MRHGRRRLFIADTSLIGHFERGALDREGAVWVADAFEPEASSTLAVSVVTVAEIRFGFGLARWGWRRRAPMERWLRHFLHLPVSRPIADAWARLKIAAARRGRTFGVNDLWIAATGLVSRAPIVTSDRDFLPMRDLGVGVIYFAPRTETVGDA